MEINQSICCRDLKKADVLDMNGEKIGHIGDLTFKFDGDLKLSQFILAGPAFEEFLEALKIRPNKDPVFDASLIKNLGEKVQLDTTQDKLKTTLDDCAIGDDEIRLSKIEKLEILDENGESVGKAVDIDFDVDGSASLIVGGGFFEEKLEALGLKTDVDIVVPGKVINSIGDKIHLGVPKSELALTMEDAVKPVQSSKAQEDMKVHREISKIRLYSQRPF
ncbi:MAG: PRC-barrel domain-containing protein [Candidatus Thorarchaeota archaeon]|jgi:sporulation protein YlmC with PRC-barrel domain